MSGVLDILDIKTTDEAEDRGPFITRAEYIALAAGRAALRKVFDQLADFTLTPACMQLRADIATQMSVWRETRDAASDLVKASVIGLGLVSHQEDEENAERPTPNVEHRIDVHVNGRKVHELKSWPTYFDQIERGVKTFEARRDDRGFQLGHLLLLREWDQRSGFSGRELTVEVTSIMREDPLNPLAHGYVIMSIHRRRSVKEMFDNFSAPHGHPFIPPVGARL